MAHQVIPEGIVGTWGSSANVLVRHDSRCLSCVVLVGALGGMNLRSPESSVVGSQTFEFYND
jgi:hypothetical protein